MDSLSSQINSRIDAVDKKFEEDQSQLMEDSRTLLENMPVGVYRRTPGPKGRFLKVNPAFLDLFGYGSIEELKQMTAADLYVDPIENKDFSDRLLTEETVTGVELQLKKKDGTPFYGVVTASVKYKPETKEVGYIDGTVEDITERKIAEVRLQESKERYRNLVERVVENIKDFSASYALEMLVTA